MPRFSGWQVVGMIFGTLLVVMCLSILSYTLTAKHAPTPALDGDVQLFQVGPFRVIEAFANFAFLVAIIAMLITFFRGNRRAAVRWLVVAVACIGVIIAALILGASGWSSVG